jgi:fatty acid desaturase
MARDQRHKHDEAVRITTAASSRQEDISARQRRYVVSMSIRTICFVGAIVAALAGIGWLWPILIAAALILPYVAVVMANAAVSKSDGFELRDGQFGRPELGSGTDSTRDPD